MHTWNWETLWTKEKRRRAVGVLDVRCESRWLTGSGGGGAQAGQADPAGPGVSRGKAPAACPELSAGEGRTL